MILYLATTLFFALFNPTYGTSLSARAAEWGRQHSLGGFVTWVENELYSPPKTGGAPPKGSFGSGTTVKKFASHLVLAPPTNIISPAKTPLPGEGVWHVAGRTTANGIPTVYEAFVRPDAVHTSFVVGVAWMDTNLLSAQLYSGSVIPGGGHFSHTAPVSAKDTEDLVAAFNAGFLTSDSNGGYYTDGQTIIPLRKGAASVVIFKNGRMTVAKWGRDVVMTNQIASVRQNLDLIVDNAKPVAGLNNPNSIKWGKVLGNSYNVWRSGLGITKDGALVYVGGPSMSMTTDDNNSGGSISSLAAGMPMTGGRAVDFITRTALDAQQSSEEVRNIAARVQNQATYPGSQLGTSLKLVAKLIGGGLPTRVYYVSQGGYDTHTNQLGTQARLLQDLGDSMKSFVDDLKAQGNMQRVLVMTFSEFGRRVSDNANGGTDHGAAAPMFVVGNRVKAGLLGKYPSLVPQDLFQGDVKYNVDFRNVYAGILENWLKTKSEPVLGKQFEPMQLV